MLPVVELKLRFSRLYGNVRMHLRCYKGKSSTRLTWRKKRHERSVLRSPVQERQNCKPNKTFLDTEVQHSVEPKAASIRFRSCCRDRSGSFEVPRKSRSPFHGLAYLRLPRGEVNVVRSCCYKQYIGAIAGTGSFIWIQSAAIRASYKQKIGQQAVKKPACASRWVVALPTELSTPSSF